MMHAKSGRSVGRGEVIRERNEDCRGRVRKEWLPGVRESSRTNRLRRTMSREPGVCGSPSETPQAFQIFSRRSSELGRAALCGVSRTLQEREATSTTPRRNDPESRRRECRRVRFALVASRRSSIVLSPWTTRVAQGCLMETARRCRRSLIGGFKHPHKLRIHFRAASSGSDHPSQTTVKTPFGLRRCWVDNGTNATTRNPSGMVTRPGWLNGANARVGESP